MLCEEGWDVGAGLALGLAVAVEMEGLDGFPPFGSGALLMEEDMVSLMFLALVIVLLISDSVKTLLMTIGINSDMNL